MKLILRILYWANVALLVTCAVVFAWTRLAILLIRSSEADVPFRLEAGFSTEKEFRVRYPGRYDLALRITKRENGKPTMDPEQLANLSMGDKVDAVLRLTSGESEICSGSTLEHKFLGSTDAAYYLGIGTVLLTRGETYRLHGTSRTSVPELTGTNPSLTVEFSPSWNKSFNVFTGVLAWLTLRVGLISGTLCAMSTLRRIRRKRNVTQQTPGAYSSKPEDGLTGNAQE